MSAGVGTKSNSRSQAYCTGRYLLTSDDFERLRANPEDSGRLRTTPEDFGTSGSDFARVGIGLTIAGVGSESLVRFKEHITSSWLRRNDPVRSYRNGCVYQIDRRFAS